MGGCCSAQGTAKGTEPSPGAPAARDKAKSMLTPADAKTPTPTPAKTAAKEPAKEPVKEPAKPPAKAEVVKAPADAKAASTKTPEAKESTDGHADTKEEKPAATSLSAEKAVPATATATAAEAPKPTSPPPAPPSAATETAPAPAAAAAAPPASSTHEGPPAAQAAPHPRSPPTAPLGAHSVESAPLESLPQLKAEESATAHPGNSPTSTMETKAFPYVEEPESTSPPPHSEAEAEATVEDVTPAPASETPERTPAPHRDAEKEEAAGTRGPSTAQVEEVPPTPVHDSDVATGKALPADDARVLQRVPPPPPPPPLPTSASAPETPKEQEGKGVEEAAEPAEAASNPLADILRRQQEEKQRYPTALTTDAADDAPLEISMEEDRNETAIKAAAGAAKYAAPEPEEKEEKKEEEEAAPHADGDAPVVPETSVDTSVDEAALPQGVLYKILRASEWAELREMGVFAGTAADHVKGYITLGTAEQATEAAETLQAEGASPCVLLCCPMAALAKPAADRAASTPAADASPLRWESVAHTGQREPRLYRALHRDADVLWSKECASGAEIVGRLQAENEAADATSDAATDPAGDNVEPEKRAVVDDAEDGEGDVGNKPISFTDTSEIEREQAADTTPRMTPPAEDKDDEADSFDIPDKPNAEGEEKAEDTTGAPSADEDADEEQPQAVVRESLPAIALAPPAGVVPEARSPTQHVVSAMHAPEAAPVSPREGGLVAPPRRVPPPLPSPPAESNDAASSEDAERKGEATPPPSRSAPQTIMSPPAG